MLQFMSSRRFYFKLSLGLVMFLAGLHGSAAAEGAPSSLSLGPRPAHAPAENIDCNYTPETLAFMQSLPPPISFCPGDMDGSRAVTLMDLTMVIANFGSVYGRFPATGPGDADFNGKVTILDITKVLNNLGNACP